MTATPIIWQNLKVVLILSTFLLIFYRYFKLRWKKDPLRQKIFLNLLVFCYWLGLFYLGIEFYFRYLFDQSDNYAVLKTHKAWSKRHETVNQEGFRDKSFESKRGPEIVRLAVVGDSFAWGGGLNQTEDRFSNRLETLLKQKGEKIEIFNLAKPGADTQSEYEILTKYQPLYQFDAVVLAYYLNDIGLNVDTKTFEKTVCYLPDSWCFNSKHPLLHQILKKSYALEFFYYRFLGFSHQIRQFREWETAGFADAQIWQKQEKNLKAFIDYCRQNKISLTVIIFPYLSAIKPDQTYPYLWIHEKLLGFFQKEKVSTIDLLAYLKNYPTRELIVNPLDYHPSPLVHKIAAEALLPMVEDFARGKTGNSF